MAANRFVIKTPPDFNFANTVTGHGWYHLRPFYLDPKSGTLSFTFNSERGPSSIEVAETSGKLDVITDGVADDGEAADAVRHVLRLDDDLNEFYELASNANGLGWVKAHGAGRMLRSPTVWEDLIKTICTTNCSWALTRKMVDNLVGTLGEGSAKPLPSSASEEEGRAQCRAFPTAEAMASVSESFYRDEIKAGYRSPYLVELAESVAAGKLDPESWLHSCLPAEQLKKEIKKFKGIGDYAAENLLKLLGRYDGLALDSWLRARFFASRNGDKPCTDKKIEKHYGRFGQWRGLAIWCDMTRDKYDQV